MDGVIRRLGADDLPQLYRMREISFLDTSDPDDQNLRAVHERLLPYRRGLFVGDLLSSSASLLPFEMYLGGKLVEMGGWPGYSRRPSSAAAGTCGRSCTTSWRSSRRTASAFA
ncbi:MAG: GNAT family N-acetyltransferase [Deinococcota bacterium]|jgi:hypothetical protein|nr:GNAT family N-acetyltransferase [Deinococcota bacterium]